MKPITDLTEAKDTKAVTVALTGDGRTETNILRAMAERYSGKDYALKLPENPAILGHGYNKTGRFPGYSALGRVQTYVSKFNLTEFLFLLDMEHIHNPQAVDSEISQSLAGFGFSRIQVRQLAGQAYFVSCNLGVHFVTIHVVVCGRNKCIEENISELISLEYGVSVEPEHNSIHGFLKQTGIDLYGLIKKSKLKSLQAAFRDLTTAFESIEQVHGIDSL
jgi:hypothetical protein